MGCSEINDSLSEINDSLSGIKENRKEFGPNYGLTTI